MPTSYIAAAWMTASQPSIPARIALAVAEVAGDGLAADLGQLGRFLGAAHQADDLVAAVAQLACDRRRR